MSSADTLKAEVSTDLSQADEKTPATETCKKTRWLVDSGASCHSTFDKSLFASYTPLQPGEKMEVKVANDELVKVAGIGDVCFRTSEGVNLLLKEVRHVPCLNDSLISVPTLDDQGYTSLFNCGTYRLTRDTLTAAKVEKVGKKYFVDGTIISSHDPLSELWHKRLGHLNSCGLESLVQRNLLSGLQNPTTGQCFYCPSTRPEEPSCGKSDFLKFVHIALRGPFYKPSFSGAVYFVTFIDDYSGKTWCYALKETSEVLNAFVKFRSYAEGHTRKRVECVFDDQGHEFSSGLQEYCRRNGIHYLSTLPRAVSAINLARTTSDNISNRIDYLLANAKLPKLYWELALDATVHVLNLCPVPCLKNDVPDRVWFGKDASYDHLRVFGCRAVVRKGTDLTQECIFVGYDEDGVGYRFYDPVKMELILGTDAEFFEEQSIMDTEGGKQLRQDAKSSGTVTETLSTDAEIVQERSELREDATISPTSMTSWSMHSNVKMLSVFKYLRKVFRRKIAAVL